MGLVQGVVQGFVHVSMLLGFFFNDIELVEEKGGSHVGHSQVIWRDFIDVLIDLFLLLRMVNQMLFDVLLVAST